jgi:hypothetical protein
MIDPQMMWLVPFTAPAWMFDGATRGHEFVLLTKRESYQCPTKQCSQHTDADVVSGQPSQASHGWPHVRSRDRTSGACMEDEPVLKMIWSRVMHARGFVVHVADSAADAVRLAEAVRSTLSSSTCRFVGLDQAPTCWCGFAAKLVTLP